MNSIIYNINEKKQTASITGFKEDINHKIIIPRSILYNNRDYIITTIEEEAFKYSKNLQSIEFSEDSEIQVIKRGAFSDSSLISISIPSSLVKLEEGWCDYTPLLNKISVKPNNPIYSTYKDIFIIGKSSPKKKNYDMLVFSVRNIKTAIIPDFIEIICPYSFNKCSKLENVEFSKNSKCRIIEKCAFIASSIVSIKIPSHLTQICENSFYECFYLVKVEIPKNSELQKIEEFAFSESSIENITIPSNLLELNDGWCGCTCKLNNIEISPNNPNYINFENNFILSKSNSNDFDVIIFARRNILNVNIPSFIKIIGSYSFEDCQINKINFSSDSNLLKINENSFLGSSINKIIFPSSLNEISKRAFSWCEKLEIIEFEKDSKLKIINNDAFFGSSIKSIHFPPSISIIESEAFHSCRLQIIEFDENSKIKIIRLSAFQDNECLLIMIPLKLISYFKSVIKI